jgi:hypothetical protein
MNRREAVKACLGGAVAAAGVAVVAGASEITRVSCEIGDPAYRPSPWFIGDYKVPTIFLNGEKQTLVMTADSRLGMVRRYKSSADGRTLDEMENVFGVVRIEIS